MVPEFLLVFDSAHPSVFIVMHAELSVFFPNELRVGEEVLVSS